MLKKNASCTRQPNRGADDHCRAGQGLHYLVVGVVPGTGYNKIGTEFPDPYINGTSSAARPSDLARVEAREVKPPYIIYLV